MELMTLIVLWGIFDDPVDGYGEPAGCSCEDDNNNHLGNIGHVLVVNFILNPYLLCYPLYPDQDASVEDNQSSESGVMSVSKAVFHLSRHTSRMKFLN